MDPYYMFKVGKDGEVMTKLFDTKKLPNGWSDSPKAAKEAAKKPVTIVKTDLLTEKPPEVKDGNSTGFNQLGGKAIGDTSGRSGA